VIILVPEEGMEVWKREKREEMGTSNIPVEVKEVASIIISMDGIRKACLREQEIL
jgi:hypothetical protein